MKQVLVLLTFIVSAWCTVQAALPVAVDGQALPTLAPMLEKVQKSVVSISTDLQVRSRKRVFHNDPFFQRFFDQSKVRRERYRQMAAAGVVVDAKNGYILTNEHSIVGASEIIVTFSNGVEVPAQLIGVDETSDVAVIQVAADNLTPIDIGDSAGMRVGDFVVSVGDPLGSQSTITSGLISALSKDFVLEKRQHFIQSDAGYGPGILVNLRGEFIGINIARVAQTAGSTRIGFSTPSNLAIKLKDQIIQYGAPQRGFLPVQVQDLTPELASVFDIDARQGAIITSVEKNSLADESGIKPGDVVLEIDQIRINRGRDLRTLFNDHFAGDTVDLLVMRDGEERLIEVTLENVEVSSRVATMIHHQLDGATFNEVKSTSPEVPEGVRAVNVKKGSAAWNHGVRENDLVVSANRREIKNLNDFRQAIDKKDVLMLNIVRDDGALFLLCK